jgi:hypothetical protein
MGARIPWYSPDEPESMACRVVPFVTVEVSLIVLCLAGCLRSDGRNSDCRWPGENPVHQVTAWHLSQDAEFGEDLAIRYADVHHGLRTPYYQSGEAYRAARESCMAALFAHIAEQHKLPANDIYNALGRNRTYLDSIEILPFVGAYYFIVAAIISLIWRRYYPADHGWFPGVLMILLLSFGLAAGGLMLGEVWSWTVERFRVGNPHMSYRAQRLVWSRHPIALFTGALVICWLAGVETIRRMRPSRQ